MIQATVPYFTFDGEATEALDFYKKVFQAEITQMRYFHELEGFSGDKKQGERILHARLTKDEKDLFLRHARRRNRRGQSPSTCGEF